MKSILHDLGKAFKALSSIFLDWSNEAKKASDEAIKKRNDKDS